MTPQSLADADPFAVEPEWDAWEVAAAEPPTPPMPDFDAFERETEKLTPKPTKYKTAAPPPPPGRTNASYGHANDAVRPPGSVDLGRLEHLRGRNIVTIDLDGTVYDRENCHPTVKGSKGQFGWQDDCDHVKRDVIERIEQMCAEQDAVPVVMSWRGGATDESRRWLGHVGLTHDAVFIPGSEDDIAGLEMHWTKDGRPDHAKNRSEFGGGQVAFKQATVTALEKHLGAKVVGAFDDNPKVTDALAKHGVANTVTIENAARARRSSFGSRSRPSGSQGGMSAKGCASCSETFDYVNVRPSRSNSRLCTDCEASGAAAPSRPRDLGRPSADDMWAGSRPVAHSGRRNDFDVPF